jgi:hypothetical protein
MRLNWRWLAIGAVALAAFVVVYVALNPYVLLVFTTKPLEPPTPPLLVGAGGTRTRVHHSGCPPWDAYDLRNPGSIEERVERAFPAGTPQFQLVNSLSRQGFKIEPTCVSDPTIAHATFNQSGGGFYGPYPAFSEVTWKVDRTGRVIWASGYVTYTGP